MAEAVLGIGVALVVWAAGAAVTWSAYGPAIAVLLWAVAVPTVLAAFVWLVDGGRPGWASVPVARGRSPR